MAEANEDERWQKMLKLYRVTCRGMQDTHGTAYVVAQDPSSAYAEVREYLDKNSLGFPKERELLEIRLLASEEEHPDCGVRVYL